LAAGDELLLDLAPDAKVLAALKEPKARRDLTALRQALRRFAAAAGGVSGRELRACGGVECGAG